MIAPQVVLIERPELFVYGDNAGAGGVDGQRGDLVAGNIRSRDGLARSFGKGAHVVFVTLRGVIGIVFLAMQRIFSQAGAEAALRGIDDRDAHAQRAEIHTSYDGHELSSKLGCTL